MLPLPVQPANPGKMNALSLDEGCMQSYTSFLKQFDFFKQSDLEGLEKYWNYYTVKKNQPVLLSNSKNNSLKFICNGATKQYLEDTTREYIISFVTEGDFCTPVTDFTQHLRMNDNVVSAETVYGMEISFENYQLLLIERPVFKKFFQWLLQDELNYFKGRVKEFQSLDAIGRYKLLLEENPEVIYRFKASDISNYLGIKPETLSRIRSADVIKSKKTPE